MKIRLPKDARRRSGLDPQGELQKVCNKLYYGDENQSSGPGERTMFRGVVCVGAVLAVPEPGGEPMISVGASWTHDDSEPDYALALAEHLRRVADALERSARS